MLSDDAKARRSEALENVRQQMQLSDHFHTIKPEDKPEPYSDELFKDAAIQWLIEMDQVCIASSTLSSALCSHFFCSLLLCLNTLCSNT
jgi:hypothetical protein